jgi:hypothetical protein
MSAPQLGHGWITQRSALDHTLGDADDALLAHGRGEALLLVLQQLGKAARAPSRRPAAPRGARLPFAQNSVTMNIASLSVAAPRNLRRTSMSVIVMKRKAANLHNVGMPQLAAPAGAVRTKIAKWARNERTA